MIIGCIGVYEISGELSAFPGELESSPADLQLRCGSASDGDHELPTIFARHRDNVLISTRKLWGPWRRATLGCIAGVNCSKSIISSVPDSDW
jgi:hypothetical protein